MYKIHVFDEAFFFLATVTMITENVNSNNGKGNKFVTIMQLIHLINSSATAEELLECV